MTLLLDPRKGDVEDDTSSTKGRSLLSLAGTLTERALMRAAKGGR